MNRRDFLWLSGMATVVRPVPVRARVRQSDSRVDEIAALVTSKMAEYRVPGVGLGILKNGQVTIRGFGVTNVDDPQPVTADTVFTIASISKTVTATAVMKLIEQKRAELKAPIQKYLPEFRVQDEKTSREVSFWHLLTHSPGWEGQLSSEDRGAEALAHFATTILRELPQLAPAGTVWSYNNAGFSLAGRLIEIITSRNIHDALRELVFTPLGMTRSFTRVADAITYRVTLGHREQNGRTQVIRPYQSTSGTTAGGVMTSLTDLMRYAQFHLGDGTAPDGKPYLPGTLVQEMRAPQLRKNSTDDEMGAGWHLRRLGGVLTAAHGGTLNGHCLLLQLVPARNLAFTILTNHTDGWRLVQDVEAAILKRYENIALAANQPIGHRGVNEAMSFHSTPLAPQPPLDEYVGTYRRPPGGTVTVRVDAGKLVAASGNAQTGTTMVFYGKDVAYATAGGYVGSPYEFIRESDGRVGWIRVNGRIARKDRS